MRVAEKKHSLMVVAFVLLIMLFIQGIVWKSFETGYGMTAKYTPLVDAAMEIKLEAALGHLWLEEIALGSTLKNYKDDVEPRFSQALWYANAMLNGGQNEEGVFIALSADEERMRKLVQEAHASIIQIKEAAEQRVMSSGMTDVDGAKHQSFNDSFNAFLHSIDDVETELQFIITRDLEEYVLLRNVLLFVIFFVFLLALLSYRFVLKNERAFLLNLLDIKEENVRLSKHLEMTLQKAPEAVCWVLKDGKFSYVNDAFCDITGFSRSELLNKSILDLYIEDDHDYLQQNWDIVKQKKKLQYDAKIRTATGHIIEIEVMAGYASDNNQEIKISYLRDMTDRNRLLDELETLNNGLAKSQELIDRHIPIATTDLHGVIVDCNLAYSTLTGYSKDELASKGMTFFFNDKSSAQMSDQLWVSIMNNQTWEGEFKDVRKDGSDYWVKSIINPYFDSDGIKIGYKTVREEITDKKALEVLATTDFLTSVFNKTKFNEFIEYELIKFKRNHSNTTLVLCDIDFFKSINDEYGVVVK